jgi:hypothetical protein
MRHTEEQRRALSPTRILATSFAPDPGGIPPRFTGTITPRSFDLPARGAHPKLPRPAPSGPAREGAFLSGARGQNFPRDSTWINDRARPSGQAESAGLGNGSALCEDS